MPHYESLTTEDVKDMFNYSGREHAAFQAKLNREIVARREMIRIESIRLNEISRLRNAKQEVFDFAKPGEDWGSL